MADEFTSHGKKAADIYRGTRRPERFHIVQAVNTLNAHRQPGLKAGLRICGGSRDDWAQRSTLPAGRSPRQDESVWRSMTRRKYEDSTLFARDNGYP